MIPGLWESCLGVRNEVSAWIGYRGPASLRYIRSHTLYELIVFAKVMNPWNKQIVHD